MSDSHPQPAVPHQWTLTEEALDRVSAVLNLEIQRLQLQIERIHATQQRDADGTRSGVDAVVRLRRAA